MNVRRATRGQPLVALLLVLGCWVGARVLLWDVFDIRSDIPSVQAAAGPADSLVAAASPPGQVDTGTGGEPVASLPAASARRFAVLPVSRPWPAFGPAVSGIAHRPLPGLRVATPRYSPLSFVQASQGGEVPVRVAAAHQMLWMAVLQVPLPMGLAVPLSERAAAPFYPAAREADLAPRWSGDGWLLLRQGGNGALVSGPAPSTYGASQAGAVLRYRLAPTSGHRPAAYLRTTAALNGSNEREAALGFSARLFAGVPVIAAAELRATDQAGGTRLRPAVMAVTELPPFELAHKLRGEAYAQAGYVGGRFATAFVDGQLRVDRGVATIGRGELRAGAGAWGGAQKGASRLDVGPAATMGMGLGASASARVAVDWRFRIAGDAKPTSGPALTLSAGF